MLQKLKFVNPNLNLEKKIAIVSNSPENLNNENGEYIDSYDVVVGLIFLIKKVLKKILEPKQIF